MVNLSGYSAKQFGKILSSEEKNYLYTLNVNPEKTQTKTLGKQVACLIIGTNNKQCVICKQSIPYIDYKDYIKRQYCSVNCKNQDIANININANNALRNNKEAVKKREITLERKYGVSNIMRSDSTKEQRRQKCLETYGVEHSSQRDHTVKKRQETNISRYGVSNYLVKYNNDLNLHPKLTISYDKLLNLKNITPVFSAEDYKGIIYNKKAVDYKFKCTRCYNVFIKNICSWNDIERCHVCDKTTNTYEQYIEDILIKRNVVYEKHNRTILDGLEIDFYLPELKIGIEINGLYYHSNKFIQDKQYHIKKTELCEQKGIKLLHIFGDEINNKKALSTRLQSILKLNRCNIGARRCEVRQISNKIKAKFVKKYHLQGDIPSNINYGLFYKNRLLSIMTFGHYRSCTGSSSITREYELYRYCTMKGVSVIGGAAKLFKAFIRNYTPTKIISYADRRYSSLSDSIYTKIGMQFSHTTIPNYWIVIGNKRYHRYGYRKSVLAQKLKIFNIELTEHENLKLNNLNIIYDCGSYKFEYSIQSPYLT